MSDRIKQFFDDASKGYSNKTIKEINTLKKFLYNNQETQFHEKDKVKIFSTIQLFYNYYTKLETDDPENNYKKAFFNLIEDCLKVSTFPFKYKKIFLKWYEELLGEGNNNNNNQTSSNTQKKKGADNSKYDWRQGSDDDDEEEDEEEEEDE